MVPSYFNVMTHGVNLNWGIVKQDLNKIKQGPKNHLFLLILLISFLLDL